mgnify:CR=1 FL=1
MAQGSSGLSTLNFNILIRLTIVGVIACVVLAIILLNGFKTDALENIEQQSNEQIQRTAQMFMVSTVKFNEEFTRETDVKKRRLYIITGLKLLKLSTRRSLMILVRIFLALDYSLMKKFSISLHLASR